MGVALLEAADRPAMIEVLLAELERLVRAGADLAIFASNTPHLARLEAVEGIEAVILGGTELALLLRDAGAVVPMLNTTSIHVDAAISRPREP